MRFLELDSNVERNRSVCMQRRGRYSTSRNETDVRLLRSIHSRGELRLIIKPLLDHLQKTIKHSEVELSE